MDNMHRLLMVPTGIAGGGLVTSMARLMIKHNVGVVPETTYVIKKLDENYFAEE